VDHSTTQPATILELLDQGPGTRLHWFPERVAVTQLAETLVGMANSEGGVVLLGISPRSGRVQGVRDSAGVIDLIFQAALLAEPSLILPLPQIETVDGAQVVRVSVPPGLPQVYNHEGRYLQRLGIQTVPITPPQLRQLLMERGILQFESQIPPNVSRDDLDPDQLAAYLAALNLPENEPFEDVLVRRGCLRVESGDLKPTYAALLLFGREPQQWLPSATILAARFPGVTFSDEFIKHNIRGTLPDQLRQTEVFARDQLRAVARIIGLERQETPEYPLAAVRELLVNAVAHRDYNQQGDGIHLHIFADRLEIHSPGVLPGPVNLLNLLDARFSRNPVVAQVLSDLGFVERLGYGLNRVVGTMRQYSLPDPEFVEVGGSFRVTLRNAVAGTFAAQSPIESVQSPDLGRFNQYLLNSRQEAALSYIVLRGRINNRTYQTLCPDVSAETLRRDLVDLVKQGVLIKVGDKKSTYYILK